MSKPKRWGVIPHFVNALAWREDNGTWTYKTSCLIGRTTTRQPAKTHLCDVGDLVELAEGWFYVLDYNGVCHHFKTEAEGRDFAHEFCRKHGIEIADIETLDGVPVTERTVTE